MKLNKKSKRQRRLIRVRKKIQKNISRPRLSVFRSGKHIYAQIIDDTKGKTLVTASEKDIGKSLKKKKSAVKKKVSKSLKPKTTESKTHRANLVGTILAQRAKDKKIKKVTFDRGPYKYHGRIKALAESAKKEGLIF